MFNLEEFEDTPIVEKVDKLNKLFNKEKLSKIPKIVDELGELLDQQKYVVPITYILSILAENDINLISEELIQKIDTYLDSDNEKLKVNSIITIGFIMMADPKSCKKYFYKFTRSLLDISIDIRNNIHYFLLPLVNRNPNLADLVKNILIESLFLEKSKENIISLLSVLEKCTNLEFDQLYRFRIVSKSIISLFKNDKQSEIFVKLILVLNKFFTSLPELELEKLSHKELENLLEEQIIMKKHNFSEITKTTGLKLKDYLNKFRKSSFKDKKIYFYTKTRENKISIYELEKEKIINFFNEKMKVSNEKIIERFSQIIEDESELAVF
ncbi:MAG: hypothetical protein ACFFAN_14235, partial [Promethearchaeota archaeon]